MAHHVQINQDQTVLDDIPYSNGDIAELDDDAFNAIPPGMFTSGKLTDLGAVSGGGGFDAGAPTTTLEWLGVIPTGGFGQSLSFNPPTPGYLTRQDATQDQILVDDIEPTGTDFGDLVLQHGTPPDWFGADSVYFGRAGLFLIAFSFYTQTAATPGTVYLQVQMPGTASAGWQGQADMSKDYNYWPYGHLLVPVMNNDVAQGRPDTIAGGMSFQPSVAHDTGSDATFGCHLYITRVG